MVRRVGAALGGLAALGVLAGGIAAHSKHSGAEKPIKTPVGAGVSGEGKDPYYFWVGGSQLGKSTGESAKLTQAQPKGVTGNSHSLGQIMVTNEALTQRVEFAWEDDPSSNGDQKPRLSVSSTVDGHTTDNGFVQVSKRYHPGSIVDVGKMGTYAIKYDPKSGGRWDVLYNEPGERQQLVGYYPESLWDGKFKESDYNDVWYEVAAANPRPGITMGDGKYGTEAGSAKIRDFHMFNGPKPNLTPYAATGEASSPSGQVVPKTEPISGDPAPPYNFGNPTRNGLNAGGPGFEQS